MSLGDTCAKEVPDTEEEKEVHQSATSYVVIDNMDFPFSPRNSQQLVASTLSIVTHSQKELWCLAKRKKRSWNLQHLTKSHTSAATEDLLTLDPSVMGSVVEKTTLNMSEDSTTSNHSPIKKENPKSGTDTATGMIGELGALWRLRK